MDFTNEEDLMLYFRENLKGLKERNSLDLAPHLVMSHGFMEWYKLVCDVFPSMSWRGAKIENKDGEYFDEYMCILFKRFWIGLMQEDLNLTDKEKDWLLVEGWKEYLKD